MVTRRVLLLTMLLGSVVVVVFLYANSLASASRDVLVGLVLIVVSLVSARLMALPLSLGAALRDARLGPWMGIGFGLGYGLGTMVQISDVASLPPTLDSSFVVVGALVSAVGFVAAVAAYRATSESLAASVARVLDKLRGSGERDYTALAVWALFLLGMFGYVVAYRIGRFGYIGDAQGSLAETSSIPYLTSLLNELAFLALILAGWRWSRDRSVGRFAQFGLIAGILMVTALLLGMKEGPIAVGLAAALGVLSIPRARVLPWAAGLVVLLLVVTPFINHYRDTANLGSGVRASLSEVAPLLQPDNFVEVIGGTSASEVWDQIRKRVSRPSEVGIVVQYTPSRVPYAPLSEVIQAPLLGFVPRSIWSGKPVLADGYFLRNSYYGGANTLSNVAVPPYADLYRHGGVLVVVLGMAVLGLIIRIVDVRQRPSSIDPTQLFLPFLLFFVVFKQENPYTNLMASLVSLILLSVLATRIAAKLSPVAHGRRASTMLESGA